VHLEVVPLALEPGVDAFTVQKRLEVLRCIAREGRMAARSISDALGISIRSAQSALEELVQNGSCQRHKIGRAVEYAVEDTTFQEPTAHR
jgi:predicted ArsR family transcriptional regulator